MDTDYAERIARTEKVVLDGLARGGGPFELIETIATIARKGDLVLGESLIGLAAHALELGGFSAVEPLEYEGLREKYLPELEFLGKVAHRNSQYALYSAAALRGGVRADFYSDAVRWNAELWQYALYAVVAYVRATAEKRGEGTDAIACTLAAARGVSISL